MCLSCRERVASKFLFQVKFASDFGWIAQLVEQRIEDPCVIGSIPILAILSVLCD